MPLLYYSLYAALLYIRLFRQRAENTKFKDRQAGEHIILLVHNKHRLLKLRNTKKATLQLTKLKLYNAKKSKSMHLTYYALLGFAMRCLVGPATS